MPITKEMVDIFCPKHDRTSCNDTRLCNGLDTASYGARCVRCALLQIIDEYEGKVPADYVLSSRIEKKENVCLCGRNEICACKGIR